MKRTLATIIAVSLIGTSAVAAGEVSFAYHARELATNTARAAVHERLIAAAGEFCMVESRRSLKAFRREKSCVAEVAGQLVARIGDDSLSAVHAASTGYSDDGARRSAAR